MSKFTIELRFLETPPIYKVFDFDYSFNKEELKEIIKNQTGIMTDADNIAIYGICEECNSK